MKRAAAFIALVAALGCARRGALPLATGPGSVLAVPVVVDFSRSGAQLDVMQPRGGPIVAHCNTDCTLALPPARYDLRVTGEGPNTQIHLDLRRPAAIHVRVGHSGAYSAGAGTGLVGALAAFALPAAMFHAVSCSEGEPSSPSDSRACSRTTGALALVGLSGVALAIAGIVVLRANDTLIHVEQPTASPLPVAPFADGQGFGFRF